VNLLLDTHVLLWWDGSDPALPGNVQDMIRTPDNDIFVSAASVWEIAIKRRLGKLVFRGPIAHAIAGNGFHEVPILPSDGENAGDLDWLHTDPFDRLLVVQAMRLGFTLLTADRSIRTFGGVAQIWAGR
jgi:PIN domain nuclease of toxin-antitoxin system